VFCEIWWSVKIWFLWAQVDWKVVFGTLMPSVWAKGQLFPKQMMEKKKKGCNKILELFTKCWSSNCTIVDTNLVLVYIWIYKNWSTRCIMVFLWSIYIYTYIICAMYNWKLWNGYMMVSLWIWWILYQQVCNSNSGINQTSDWLMMHFLMSCMFTQSQVIHKKQYQPLKKCWHFSRHYYKMWV